MKRIIKTVILLAFPLVMAACASTKNTVEKPVSSIASKEELGEIFKLQLPGENLAEEELLSLGEKYEKGEGVFQFYSMALLCYQKAKEAGSLQAESALSKLEAKKAEVLAKSPNGQGELFNFYRSGITAGQGGNFEQSYAVMYDTAFFFGDNKGLEGLASQLLKGKGIAQDYEKAALYYQKAVSDPNTHSTMLGIPQTYYALGRFYENGLGIEKDVSKAKEYYQKALDAANETLALEFASGRDAAAVTKAQAESALKRFQIYF